MNEIIIWLITILSFSFGLYLGAFWRGQNIAKEIKQKLGDTFQEKPKPGVVQHLTEEEIDEKHNPLKKGNLEAFNSLFADETGQKIQEISKQLGTKDPRVIADYLKKELK